MKKMLLAFAAFIMFFVVIGSAQASGSGASGEPTILPYTAKSGSGVTYYVYTKTKFRPASANKISIAFSGNCTKVVIYQLDLYSTTTLSAQPTTLAFYPNKAGAVSTSWSWSGLNSTTYYYGYMGKTNSSVSASMVGKYS